MNEKVSIIMPAYNVEEYIADAIQSVFTQDYSNWELIIVDNASTDNTANIIQSFQDPRIILLQENKRGISAARNCGLRAVSGDFLCFLDADDRLPSSSLSMRVSYLTDHPEISFCDGIVETYSAHWEYLLHRYTPGISGDIHQEMALFLPRCFAGVTWMIRRSTWSNLLFDENWKVLEDRIFFHEIASRGLYGFVDVVTYEIRRRQGSSMSNTKLMEEHFLRFMQEVQQHTLSAEKQHSEKKHFHRIFLKTYLKEFKIVEAAKHWLQMVR